MLNYQYDVAAEESYLAERLHEATPEELAEYDACVTAEDFERFHKQFEEKRQPK